MRVLNTYPFGLAARDRLAHISSGLEWIAAPSGSLPSLSMTIWRQPRPRVRRVDEPVPAARDGGAVRREVAAPRAQVIAPPGKPGRGAVVRRAGLSVAGDGFGPFPAR